jgi:hypothetical protein
VSKLQSLIVILSKVDVWPILVACGLVGYVAAILFGSLIRRYQEDPDKAQQTRTLAKVCIFLGSGAFGVVLGHIVLERLTPEIGGLVSWVFAGIVTTWTLLKIRKEQALSLKYCFIMISLGLISGFLVIPGLQVLSVPELRAELFKRISDLLFKGK